MDLESIRTLFPVTERWIYLNHAAVAPISRRVADAVEGYAEETLKNGRRAMKGQCPKCGTSLCRILGNK